MKSQLLLMVVTFTTVAFAQQEPSEKTGQELFKKIDADGDGRISRAEGANTPFLTKPTPIAADL
jgi:Ca2+-binding EF-hand superfamily protein